MKLNSSNRAAFTLVELLVVIAIIGVLVALLLPAINAAREAARRTQCMNQLRQMGLAILNHENSFGKFPSGGVEPYPRIENYSQGGRPFGPERQGLSWAYQILPFLEEQAVQNLTTTELIQNTPISLYFCPSRRAPTFNPTDQAWLMDYASLQPFPFPPDIPQATFENILRRLPNGAGLGCTQGYSFWGTTAYNNDFNPRPRGQLGAAYIGFKGVIVRSSFLVTNGNVTELDYDQVTSTRRIRDGLSKTGMITEKWLPTNRANISATQTPFDDRGWSDGWDIDTVKSTLCEPRQDFPLENPLSRRDLWMTAGSAHPGGFHCVMGDSTVRFLNFTIDLQTFNRIGHRADGLPIEGF